MNTLEKEEAASFIDELIAEAEADEQKQTLAYFDLLIMEIANLELQIETNFNQSAKEVAIINDWALRKNQKLTEKIEILKSKLENWLRTTNQKTVDLPHGICKIRKKPDKVEVTDLSAFLEVATESMITTIPEQIKPNLPGIKSAIKHSGRIPNGIKLIEGTNEFSLTLKSQSTEVSNDTTQ